MWQTVSMRTPRGGQSVGDVNLGVTTSHIPEAQVCVVLQDRGGHGG